MDEGPHEENSVEVIYPRSAAEKQREPLEAALRDTRAAVTVARPRGHAAHTDDRVGQRRDERDGERDGRAQEGGDRREQETAPCGVGRFGAEEADDRADEDASDERSGREEGERDEGQGASDAIVAGRAVGFPGRRHQADQHGPQGVGASQHRRDERECPEHGSHRCRVVHRGEDGLFRPPAGRHDRYPGKRRRAGGEGGIGGRSPLQRAAHRRHVGSARRAMGDVPGRKEEERLEEGVDHEVRRRRRGSACTKREHHEADLADRGVGEEPLDVLLEQGRKRPEERRRHAKDGRQRLHRGYRLHQGREAHHQEGPGRHHRGRVQEGRHGRWPCHGRWQPCVQRNLRRLAESPAKEQPGDHRAAVLVHHRSGWDERIETDRPCLEKQEQQRGEKEGVGEARHDERLPARVDRGGRAGVVGDEEETAETHHLPPEEEDDAVSSQHHGQHGGKEEVHQREVAAQVSGADMRHVGNRVCNHAGADRRHGDAEERTQRIEPQRERDDGVAHREREDRHRARA